MERNDEIEKKIVIAQAYNSKLNIIAKRRGLINFLAYVTLLFRPDLLW
jgi:hypothetical protein